MCREKSSIYKRKIYIYSTFHNLQSQRKKKAMGSYFKTFLFLVFSSVLIDGSAMGLNNGWYRIKPHGSNYGGPDNAGCLRSTKLTTIGEGIFQRGCGNLRSEQKFFIERDSRGIFIIRTAGGFCLDVSKGSTVSRTPIIQWTCNPSALSQKFHITYNQDSGGGYQIKAMHSHLCFDVDQSYPRGRRRVIQYPCHGKFPQRFYLQSTTPG